MADIKPRERPYVITAVVLSLILAWRLIAPIRDTPACEVNKGMGATGCIHKQRP